MIPVSDFGRVAACGGGGKVRSGPAAVRSRVRRMHSFLQHRQSSRGHPQVVHREQLRQSGGVLCQPAIAHLDVAELALGHPERMPDLCLDPRLDVLHLLGDRVLRIRRVERSAQHRPQRHMPMRPDALRVLALVHALVAGIGEHVGFLAMHQRVRLGHVVDVGLGAHHRVHQAAFGIHANVALHPEVPLGALLGLVHLGIARARAVLRRTRRCDQRGVHRRALLEQQPLGRKRGVHGFKHLGRQIMLPQQVPKAQDAHAVGQAVHPAQARKLPVQRNIEQGLLHRYVRQSEPLQEMNAQHHLRAERRAAPLLTRRERFNQRDQLRLRHHALYLVEELALAGLAARRVQAKVS